MNNPDYRIPEDMASEVLAKAARLQMEANKGYSIRELQQAGLEAKIPLETIGQAVKIVEERQRIEQVKRQQARDKFKQRIKKITNTGLLLLIPVTLISGVLIFLPLINTFIHRPDFKLKVQEIENQKQQNERELNDANYQLKVKDVELNKLQQEINQLNQRLKQSPQKNNQADKKGLRDRLLARKAEKHFNLR